MLNKTSTNVNSIDAAKYNTVDHPDVLPMDWDLHKYKEADNITIANAIKILESRINTGPLFNSPNQIKEFLRLKLATRKEEVFAAVFVDTQYRLIEYREMSVGTIDRCAVYPREVALAALELNAKAVIFCHNHPSGDTTPSEADKRMTKDLISSLGLLDIKVLDHIIVGCGDATSFAERGLIL
jgi:DNA repair protein RadC